MLRLLGNSYYRLVLVRITPLEWFITNLRLLMDTWTFARSAELYFTRNKVDYDLSPLRLKPTLQPTTKPVFRASGIVLERPTVWPAEETTNVA